MEKGILLQVTLEEKYLRRSVFIKGTKVGCLEIVSVEGVVDSIKVDGTNIFIVLSDPHNHMTNSTYNVEELSLKQEEFIVYVYKNKAARGRDEFFIETTPGKYNKQHIQEFYARESKLDYKRSTKVKCCVRDVVYVNTKGWCELLYELLI